MNKTTLSRDQLRTFRADMDAQLTPNAAGQLAQVAMRARTVADTYGSLLGMIKRHCKALDLSPDVELPSLLARCMVLYEMNKAMYDANARDILLLSCLVSLGICFPTVRLPYGSKRYSIAPSLVIGAPAASNKSLLGDAARLLDKVNAYIIQKYKADLTEWEHKNVRWTQEKAMAAKEKREVDFSLDPGEKPSFACLRIPGNTSKSMIIHLMKAAQEYGSILISTEADTLNDANSKEYGQMDDLFCKALVNETIDKAHIVDGEPISITFPMLAILLSGTFNQVHRFISSYETGLGSRIPVYLTPGVDHYVSQQPVEDAPDFQKVYSDIGDEVLEMWKFFGQFHFTVRFTNEQWQMHTEQWREEFEDVMSGRMEMLSVSTRGGILHMRLASVLTMLRLWDEVKQQQEANASVYAMCPDNKVICRDADFHLAGMMAKTLFEHTMMFSTTKVQQLHNGVKEMENWHWEHEVVKLMPECFTVDEFMAEAQKPPFSKSKTTVYRVLAKMSKGKDKVLKKLKVKVGSKFSYQKLDKGLR